MSAARNWIAIGALLAAVPTNTAQAYSERTAVYRCGGAYGFSVIYEKTGTLLVMIGGGAYRLQGRGGAWADGRGQKLVMRGRGAVWTSAADGVRQCRMAERKAR